MRVHHDALKTAGGRLSQGQHTTSDVEKNGET
jgi:hypothetical protein